MMDRRTLTGLHEAGHIMAALDLGVPFLAVSILALKDSGGQAWLCGGALDADAESLALVYLGGPAASVRAVRDLPADSLPPGWRRPDQGEARERDVDYVVARALLREPEQDVAPALSAAEARAAAIVEEHWGQVEIVGRELARVGYLTRDEVLTLLKNGE
jgi:hypothetical protein